MRLLILINVYHNVGRRYIGDGADARITFLNSQTKEL